MTDLSMYSPDALSEYAQEVGWPEVTATLRRDRGWCVLYLQQYDRPRDEINTPVLADHDTLTRHVTEVKAKLAAIDGALERGASKGPAVTYAQVALL
jgi:hypothetical protein